MAFADHMHRKQASEEDRNFQPVHIADGIPDEDMAANVSAMTANSAATPFQWHGM